MRIERQTARKLSHLLDLARLRRPYDLGFLLALGLCANWLAANGTPDAGLLFIYLLGAFSMRCAAWVFTDLSEARFFPATTESVVAQGGVEPQQAIRLFALLCGIAFASAVYLGRLSVLFSPLALGLVLVFPYARQRTFLSTLLLALAFAWAVPMAWFARGSVPDAAGWLLFVFALFWATAFGATVSLPRLRQERQAGIRSLAGLAGAGTPLLTGLLLSGALSALLLVGRRAGLGALYHIGWSWAAVVVAYQLVLLVRLRPGDAMRAYRSNLWLGVSLYMGVLAHFICLRTGEM